MKIPKTIYLINRDDWRAWLEKNHDIETEIWLIYYKKHTNRPRIPYEDAVEEALCFGWIDSIVKKLDDERYIQKFTPRKDNSRWSELNKRRVRKLIKEGRMTKHGLAKITEESLSTSGDSKPKRNRKDLIIPQYMKKALMKNKKAWENFNNLAPSYQRNYVGWITNAKKEETRERRLKEAIGLLAKNERLGLK
ncbi:MAG: YdeI/OmpD-associated family protein [Acidobacteria bacterium]|nr:YdeI/OmpD-associated family protein [Acidobacteriota bacterium]